MPGNEPHDDGWPWKSGLAILMTAGALTRTESMVFRVLIATVTVLAAATFARQSWNQARFRLTQRAADNRQGPGRPVVGIDARHRGEWLYHPSPHDGSTEIELRLHRRRYVAVFAPDEKPAYRHTISAITATLDDGTETVDVNAAFAAAIGREPFEDHGALRQTLLDRCLASLDPPGYRGD